MTMTDDKTLLELAANAAGIEYDAEASKPHPKNNVWFGLWLVIHSEPSEYQRRYWNPLTDDGDALRLAVKLGFKVNVLTTRMEPFTRVRQHEVGTIFEEEHRDDAAKATRRAIVRAAAEIGKTL